MPFKKNILYCILIFIIYLLLKKFFTPVQPYTENNIPILIWWTPFMAENHKVIQCQNNKYKCILTKERFFKYSNKAAAYLFYGSSFNHSDIPLPKKLKWAVFHEESPKNWASFLFKDTQNLFDITSTFDRYSDFPVTLQYLQHLNNLTDNKYYVPVEIKNTYLKDLAPILYIQSDCDTPIERDYYVKEIMKYINVDSYGTCLKNRDFPEKFKNIDTLDLFNEEFLHFNAKYKFILTIENAVCDDYITEKLWRALIVGSIPIYMGSPTIKDWLPNNKSALIIEDYNMNISNLIKDITLLNSNNKLYNSYLSHKIDKKINNNLLSTSFFKGEYGLETDQSHPIPAFECYICEAMYTKDFNKIKRKRSVYNCPRPKHASLTHNSWISHWDFGKCQSKVFKYFVNKGKNFSEKEFETEWWNYYKEGKC